VNFIELVGVRSTCVNFIELVGFRRQVETNSPWSLSYWGTIGGRGFITALEDPVSLEVEGPVDDRVRWALLEAVFTGVAWHFRRRPPGARV